MDNLGVHRTETVRQLCESLDVVRIFNIAYSPDTNPIEQVFNVVKNHYRRGKAQFEVNEKDYDQAELIDDCFDKVKLSTVRNSINRSMKLLNLARADELFPQVQPE